MPEISTSGRTFFFIPAESRDWEHVVATFKDHLRKIDPQVDDILLKPYSLPEMRTALSQLLHVRMAHLYSLDCKVEDLERIVALDCIETMNNFLSERNEVMSKASVLRGLMSAYGHGDGERCSYPFYVDLINIIKGMQMMSGIYKEEEPVYASKDSTEVARNRSDHLDKLAMHCRQIMARYPSGIDKDIVQIRTGNRKRILDILGGDGYDWSDHVWQRKNTIRSTNDLSRFIDLSEQEAQAIDLAVKHRIPFGITPYYVSLMDKEPSRARDHAVRAQVIPNIRYLEMVLTRTAERKADLDFMKEGETSPVRLVTRRYPMIAIMKPYNSCAQICVYCQRNWEIRDVDIEGPVIDDKAVDTAIEWFVEHPMVSEILLTGGDPALLEDKTLKRVLKRFSELEHITRIRIGTRVPVVLPMRINGSFMDCLEEAHDPPNREVCIVTHVEHPYEITPEFIDSIQSIRRKGMSVYNQQVFTFENSRRFETAALRDLLKRSGVDPYYTFNTKGKEETEWFRVPIARILQERKEEARLLPGLTRTDEPVFNIPALGKNHLRAWQHHDMIMITPRGERVYEFHPWEKNIVKAPTYVHRDVPIIDYLDRLEGVGEDKSDYWSIWYYF
ncbi:MAG: KamA family radical SAM protein [Euryarchaeota archaeon]|nr:KamA family radical SAM protein [Euryarchaeota archaeon]